MKSIWEDVKIEVKDKKIVNKTDVLIIGAGITGITLSYLLDNSDYKVMLIDKGEIGGFVTKKTTAKITYLQGNIYSKLLNNFSLDICTKYYESQVEAINKIKDIVSINKIDCDLKETPSIIFTLKDVAKIKKEANILDRLNIKYSYIKDDKVKSGIKVKDTYTFHPLKYLKGVVENTKNIDIYENILAKNIKKKDNEYIVETSRGNIYAKKIVVCTHYPFFIIPSFIPIKTYIKREYVNAFKTNEIYNYSAISVDKSLHSIRYYDDYLIYGSNEHKLTNKIDYEKKYNKSIKDTKKLFKKVPEYTWMNQDIMSNDNLPFIGEIDNNLYIATAYNAWGMTNGTLAAIVISDLINNNYNKYQSLFSPKRVNKTLFLKSFIGSFSYLKGYTEPLFKKNNPQFIKIENIFYGVYTENGKRYMIKLVCPHMKCNLVFNKKEKTWDCPCHGSRFDIKGNLIDGPSKDNLMVEKK